MTLSQPACCMLLLLDSIFQTPARSELHHDNRCPCMEEFGPHEDHTDCDRIMADMNPEFPFSWREDGTAPASYWF